MKDKRPRIIRVTWINGDELFSCWVAESEIKDWVWSLKKTESENIEVHRV